jgi:uncharacterized glyoxalase superfamily protein PhnB
LAFSLLATNSSVNWVVGAANFTNTTSQIMIGDYNRSMYIDETSNQTLTLTSDDPDAWIFNVTMGFGLTNTSEGLVNATEFYSNVTYNVTNSDGNVTFEYN